MILFLCYFTFLVNVLSNNLTKIQDFYYKPYESELPWGDFIKFPEKTISKITNIDTLTIVQKNWLKQLNVCKLYNSKILDSSNCPNDINDKYINSWRNNSISGLCEDQAASKIECFDSPDSNRYCKFHNAMITMKKMKHRKQSDGTSQRLWEKGFLSTDCGHYAKDDIGYFSLYKPDISGSHDALCDYIINQTTIITSHDNIMNFGHTMNDILNVWTLLTLQNLQYNNQDLILLNIDGVRKGKVYDDNLYQFYKHYKMLFHEIIRSIDFNKNSKICFKLLILPIKPILTYLGRANKPCLNNSIMTISQDILHNWNIYYRYKNELYNNINRIEISILLSTNMNNAIYESINNIKILFQSKYNNINIKYINISSYSLSQQIVSISTTSILIGLRGSGLNALGMHMSIGSKYCCGVIDLYFMEDASKSNDLFNINVVQSMGFYYNSNLLSYNQDSNSVNSGDLYNVLLSMAKSIELKPTCISPNVINHFVLK